MRITTVYPFAYKEEKGSLKRVIFICGGCVINGIPQLITIPKAVREKLGVHPGEDVGFDEKDDLFIICKVVTQSPFDKWVGKLKHLKGRRSDDLVREARGYGTCRSK